MPIDDQHADEVEPSEDSNRALEARDRDYEERRHVIRLFELMTVKAMSDGSRHLMTVLLVVTILTTFTLVTPMIFIFDLVPPDTGEYYWVLLFSPMLAYVTTFWALLYVKRVRRSQRFDMENTLSLFQRELSRSWERYDALEAENRRLRHERNLAAHVREQHMGVENDE